jgi:N-acyl homoserine lactone hydrolase
MPDSLTIRAVCVGLFGGPLPSPDWPRGRVPDDGYRSAMYLFVIEGGESPVVVDTGTLGEEEARVRQNRILHRPPELEPVTALRAIGVEPEAVRVVVNTHLHWDHCAGNALFPNASVYVQRSEIAYAADPLPEHRVFYDKLPGVRPAWLDAWDRTVAVEGDFDLAPGIRLLHLPGHSPGSQAVLVETARGPFLIAGDTVNSAADWDFDDGAHRAPSLLTSLADWRASVARIEGLGCPVIPSHDLALRDAPPFGS